MKLDCSADSWLKFFTSAGIPVDSARTYAVTFSKNEIQLDMLSEIKKEYLVDMGITLMGHIIAILRHAKTVYEENVTKTTLSSSSAGSKNQSSPVKAAPKEKPVLKTMPLRIANEKEVTTATSSTLNKSSVVAAESRLRAVGTSTVQNNTYGPHPKSSSLQVSDKELPTKKKDSEPISKTKVTSVVSSTIIKKKPSAEPSHRQHEEASNVNNKGKVFERLGEEVYPPEVKTSESPSESSTSSNESVFTRLGGKTSPTYSPCNSPIKSAVNGEDSFSDFPKIKRVVQNGNKPKMKSMMCTMRADEAEMQAKRTRKRTRSPSPDNFSSGTRNDFNLLKSNIKSRLGRMSRSTTPSSARLRSSSLDRSIALRNFGEISDKRVKLRLGTLNHNTRLDEERNGGNRDTRSSKGSILSKRLSPVKSIALSGLSKTNGGIKSRLGQSALKTSPTQKKVSFGPVQQQFIPLETKPSFRRQFNRKENFGRFGIFGMDWQNNEDYDLY